MGKSTRTSRGTATIEDVARRSGLSAMTVSRVVNGEKNVRESTRAVVLQAIADLSYSPNTAAKNLASGNATEIGLLYSNPSAAYLSQFLIGALEGSRDAGCYLLIESCRGETADEQAEATHRIMTANVEGVILPPPLSEYEPVQAELDAAKIPVVGVGVALVPPGRLNVRIDDYGAAVSATRHLIQLGHERIGFIKGHPAISAAGERHRGFVSALAEAGIHPDGVTVEQGYFTYRSGLLAAERILSGSNPPTAIFASNDDMAVAAVNVAHRMGLEVPRDLSVVGFDDTAPATATWPELTTIRQPIAEMAEAALILLNSEIKARRLGRHTRIPEVVLSYELILRQSTAPPRNSRTKIVPSKGGPIP